MTDQSRHKPALSFVAITGIMLVILLAGIIGIYFIRIQSHPNHVILVVLDTVRADRLGCYGHSAPTTPNLDRFAESGLRFTEARADAPWTLPSHASLFTGTPPSTHGCNFEHRYLVDSRKTVAELISEFYEFETMGISSNVNVSKMYSLDQGFDRFHQTWDERSRFPDKTDSQIVNALVREWLSNRDSEEPFFLFLNYMDAHLPYVPPADVLAEFGQVSTRVRAAAANPDLLQAVLDGDVVVDDEFRKELGILYDAQLRVLDQRVGELLTILDEAQVRDDAFIVITSDHGELLGEGGLVDHQLSMREELLHVPLLVQMPKFSLPQTIEEPVALTQVHEWLMDAATGRIPEWTAPPEDARDAEVAEYSRPVDFAGRMTADHPLAALVDVRQFALRLHRDDRQWKYVARSDGTELLFHLPEGEDQTVPLAGQETTLARFRDALQAHRSQSLFVEFPEDLDARDESDVARANTELRQLGYLSHSTIPGLGIHESEHWSQARRARDRGEIEEASQRIQEALRMAPDQPGILLDAAQIADALRQSNALSLYQRYVQKVSGTPLQKSEYYQHAIERIKVLRRP